MRYFHPMHLFNDKVQNISEKENIPNRNSGCRLHCLVELDDGDSALCNNSRIAEPEKSISNNTAVGDGTDTGMFVS